MAEAVRQVAGFCELAVAVLLVSLILAVGGLLVAPWVVAEALLPCGTGVKP